MTTPKKPFEVKQVPGKADHFKVDFNVPPEELELKVIDGGKPDSEEKDDD